MIVLTNAGQKALEEIAQRFGLTTDVVEALARAIVNGNGTMAQFNIPELGGSGQWMQGGMTMVGDMFNQSLKTKVDQVCTAIASVVTSQIIFEETEEKGAGASTARTPSPSSTWPSIFGAPTATGSQNDFRYAYFAPVRRLVIDSDGRRVIYDTKHHEISGVSQQQGGGKSSYVFTSQDGPVDISSLSMISEPDGQKTPEIPYDVVKASGQEDIMTTIEKVHSLFEKGVISEAEYKAKKQELLARL